MTCALGGAEESRVRLAQLATSGGSVEWRGDEGYYGMAREVGRQGFDQ